MPINLGIIGRRRTGKTALIISQRGIKKDLTGFSDTIAEKFNLSKLRFESFIDAFKFLISKEKTYRMRL